MSEYDNHSNPEQIQRDIDRTRAEMGETLEMIRQKLSPGELLDQALSYLKGSGAGQFSRNLSATVQHHPIPMALLGISIAWLMFVGSRESHPSHSWAMTEWNDGRGDEVGSSLADKEGQRAISEARLEQGKQGAATARVATQEKAGKAGISRAGADQPRHEVEDQSAQVVHASRQATHEPVNTPDFSNLRP